MPAIVPPLTYDYEEGIKKYTKKIYSELLDIVQSILPESIDDREDRLSPPEDIKGYHLK